MTPLLIVSVTAFLGLTLCNLTWARYSRSLRTQLTQLAQENRSLRQEVRDTPRLRAELSALALRIQDLCRGLFPGQPLPGTLLGCLDRVDESFEAQRKATRVVRRQLSRTVDRLRQSQKELQRLQRLLEESRSSDGSAQSHLESVTAERDALRARIESLKKSLQQEAADDRVRLMHTRRELEELRLQLRSAYRSMAELETQLSLSVPARFQPDEHAEPTEMIFPAAPSEFEIM